jgi:hypothetical protein
MSTKEFLATFPDLADAAYAATVLGISPSTLGRLAKRRVIPQVRCGRFVRYFIPDLQKYLELKNRESGQKGFSGQQARVWTLPSSILVTVHPGDSLRD